MTGDRGQPLQPNSVLMAVLPEHVCLATFFQRLRIVAGKFDRVFREISKEFSEIQRLTHSVS